MAMDLAGKVAIITGGAGGIGKALAEEMAERGCYLVLADINTELLEKALVDGALNELGRIDFFFNNAGVNLCAELRDTSLDDWSLLIDVNLRGVVHGVHAAYPIMRKQGFGHIVNTASAAGLVPAAAEGAYAATKHAVVGLSMALRVEAEAFGVKVSVVCPGLVDTPILDSTKYVKLDPEVIRKVAPEKPIPPRKAAQLILRGVDSNVFFVVLTLTTHALWLLHRYAPAASMGVGKIAIGKFREFRREDD
jgi:NAD(P)-dependent dehydrogenase (short-subunit alcohol dehydrogenase family)